jgi:acetyltransferase
VRKAAAFGAAAGRVMKMSSTRNQEDLAQYETRLALKNGKTVLVRPVLQTDEPLIVDLLNRLSSDSIYLRFLRPVRTLPKELLFHLTHLDYQSNFALAAVIREDEKDAVIAVARYGFDPREHLTDFAIVVRDDWQHFGLGKQMLSRIFAIGREQGISRFVSIVDSTNISMKRMLRGLDCAVNYSYEKGFTQVEVLVEEQKAVPRFRGTAF